MKHTKHKLLSSIATLFVCFAMFIGSTYAWFTDSASTGVNKIQAGNLDIEVSYKKTDGSYASIQDATTLFSTDLWEPGHTEYVTLKVENKGTLALTYKVMVTPVSENGGINVYDQNFKLSDYLVFGTVKDANEPTYTRDTVRAAVGTTQGLTDVDNLTEPNTMLKNAAPDYITLVVYMPETVDNNANAKPGTTAPSIDLGIKVVATQVENEKDSFGNDYDAGAVEDDFYKGGAYYDYFEAVNETITATGNTFSISKTIGSDIIASATGSTTTGSKVNLVVTKTSTPSNNFGITVNAGEELNGYDIKVTGQTAGSLVQGNLYVGTGLQNFVFYHKGTAMTEGTQGSLTDGQYCYNPTDGYVYFATKTFSPFQATYVAPEAAIGSSAYGTIEKAVSAAKANDTVTLLKDVQIEAQINLPTNVTLDGRYHVIKANNTSWSGVNGSKMLLLMGSSDTVKNITLDSNSQACGVQAYAASNVKLENVTLINSKNAGLLINASQVTVSGKLTMSGNKWGENDANYINLGWGSGIPADTVGMATITFAENAFVNGVTNVWTDGTDLTNAGVSQDEWNRKFAVNGVFVPSKANGGIAFVEPVAKIGDTKYATLDDAIGAASSGATITLLKDSVGKGIGSKDGTKVRESLVIDFAGHTYTMNDPAVGSTGTETQAMHWGKSLGAVTLKNGTFKVADDTDGVYMAMQNYIDFTAENMTFDFTNIPVTMYGENEYTGFWAIFNGKECSMFNNNSVYIMTLSGCTVLMPEGSEVGIYAGEKGLLLENCTITGSVNMQHLDSETFVKTKNSTISKGVVSYFEEGTIISESAPEGYTVYKFQK